jgi:hypothetical protein
MLIYSGDPKLYLDGQGADLVFRGGQPDMEQGIENASQMVLFTTPGWPGNALFDDVDERIGSDFVDAAHAPITISSLNNIRDAAEKAFSAEYFGDVTAEVTNPVNSQIYVRITLPGQAYEVLLTTTNGVNWQFQGENE